MVGKASISAYTHDSVGLIKEKENAFRKKPFRSEWIKPSENFQACFPGSGLKLYEEEHRTLHRWESKSQEETQHPNILLRFDVAPDVM